LNASTERLPVALDLDRRVERDLPRVEVIRIEVLRITPR